VHVEEAFLRARHPDDRLSGPPLGLLIDRQGAPCDAARPSDLETLLARHPLDDTALLDRARDAIARLRDAHLSEFADADPDLAPPDPGFVLVLDQPRGDAAIRLGQANADSFAEMLTWARLDHPDATIVVTPHALTRRGETPGHFDPATLPPGVVIEDRPVSPWRLFEHARAVYTVTARQGFEALLGGHRPVTFGVPFYAGWGLTDDRRPGPARRNRRLSRAQLAAAALILHPVWYDPFRDRLCALEDALGTLEAQARAWREDRAGYVAFRMRSGKRPYPTGFFGQHGGPIAHVDEIDSAAADGRPVQVWAQDETPALRAACETAARRLLRVSEGVLQVQGAKARRDAPLSFIQDDLGNPHDPRRESRLERLIAEAADLPAKRLDRAERLLAAIARAGPKAARGARSGAERPVILVPGQADGDDAEPYAAGAVATDHELLRTARRLHPTGHIVYWPAPGAAGGTGPDLPADEVASGADPVALIARADRVVTISSPLGFQALLRDVPVTVLGAPFYAGWGLTTDLGAPPDRRHARPSRAALAHAALIACARYHDPVTDMPCPPEIAVARLTAEPAPAGRASASVLARMRAARIAFTRWLRG
jgi:capsular polysaccharide export protein